MDLTNLERDLLRGILETSLTHQEGMSAIFEKGDNPYKGNVIIIKGLLKKLEKEDGKIEKSKEKKKGRD